MTLDTWETEIHADIDRFVDYWRRMHRECPSQFPLELEAGDWDEQFSVVDVDNTEK